MDVKPEQSTAEGPALVPGRVPGFCALCRSRCGAHFVVEGGQLTGVEPWQGHPTGGALCAKGRAAPELQYHPQRLTTPLRRTTPKTDPDPRWEAVSWDEALADIAARLTAIRAESGAEAVAFSAASPGASAISDSLEWIERLIFTFGSPNFLTGVEICNWQRDHNHAFTFGTGIGMPDYANTDLVMLWGFSPGNVWLAQAGALAAARARGAKLLVVDPAPTRHAKNADRWLQVRPGTDAALALGIARELMASGMYDEAFVRRWSNAPFLIRDGQDNDDGFGQPLTERSLDAESLTDWPLAWHVERGCAVAVDTSRALPDELAGSLALRGGFEVAGMACRTAMDHYAAACEPWTAERVEAMTGVAGADVIAAARMIGAARSVSYFSWTGISQHANATQTDRAIALLYALTGSVDAPGGNLHLRRPPARWANDRALLAPGQSRRALGIAARPLGPPAHGWTLGSDFQRAVLAGDPYRVRALVGFGANQLMSQPDTAGMRAALEALEFQVHCDIFETPTARHADYLLPVNTPWEREGLRIGFEISAAGQATVQLRRPVVAMAAGNQAKSDIEIVFDLAVRLGLGDAFFGGDIEAGRNHVLAPLGLTMEALRAAPQGLRRLSPEPVQQTRQYAQASQAGAAALTPAQPQTPVRGFATPSGRVEFYSAQFAEAGIAAVPFAINPRAAFDAAVHSRFPLTLSCAKSGYYCQSQHRGAASLRGKEPEPEARLHPSLAAARGISAGDWFELATCNGSARFRAAIDDGLHPDSVLASFGWWQACEDLGLPAVDPLAPGHSNMNALVDTEVIDDVSGSAPLRSYPCEVRAIAGPKGWAGWKTFDARCVSRPAEGVIEVELTPVGGVGAGTSAGLPDFRPGQYVRVAIDVPGAGRQERCYSLIGAALNGHRSGHRTYRIAIKRSGAAALSDRMHSAFAAVQESGREDSGDPDTVFEVEVQRPAGRFLLPTAHTRPVVLMAAGIGITPFLSLLETMAANARAHAASPGLPPALPHVLLIYGNRNGAHHAFAGRITALAAGLPNLEIIDLYSQPRAHEMLTPAANAGRVTAACVPSSWIERDARFYLCGPAAMLRETTQGLMARGVARRVVFSETFASPLAFTPVDNGDHAAPAKALNITFTKSDRSAVWWPGDGNLLAMAERLGLDPPGGCRVGQCESCRMSVRSGSVRHGVETDIAQDGACLACVAVPLTDMEIDA